MTQRRRYATRAELTARLAEYTVIPPQIVGDVLEALAADGVNIDQLVKITVTEDLPDGPA